MPTTFSRVLALLCAACGSSTADVSDLAAEPGETEVHFTHDGVDRKYILYVPVGYTPEEPRPLLVCLHGGGGSAAGLFREHPLQRYADETGYVIVGAEGTPAPGGGNGWNGQLAFDSGEDDVGYLERVILDVSASLAIDPSRRYMAGFSGGATMTVRFATEKSELLAAIGTFAGKIGRSTSAGPPLLFPPHPTTPLSVQMTYGTDDESYPGGLMEGFLFSSAEETAAWWSEALGCSTTPGTEVDGDLTLDTYADCEAGTSFRLITVAGMKHIWPDEEDGLDGTKLLLDFFEGKTKASAPGGDGFELRR